MMNEPLSKVFLSRQMPQRELMLLDETDSTFIQMKRWARSGAKHGSVLLAESQTSGRGRMGRVWTSPKHSGLYFSYLIRTPLPVAQTARLTPALALGVCNALNFLGLKEAKIKWPNDIVADGKKICGILCEMELDGKGGLSFVQAGIGLNVRPFSLPEELRDKAGFMDDFIRKSREEILVAVLHSLDECVELARHSFPAVLAAYKEQCITLGKEVKASGGQCATGRAVDINEEGELIVLDCEGVLHTLRTADVSVRGVMGYV